MTKLLTSIAAMQIVEKGLISLEDDVSSYIPELAKQPVLKGFDSSEAPITAERKNPIKFVHLLTHSAGTAYDLADPALIKYRNLVGHPPDRATLELSQHSRPLGKVLRAIASFPPRSYQAFPPLHWLIDVSSRHPHQ